MQTRSLSLHGITLAAIVVMGLAPAYPLLMESRASQLGASDAPAPTVVRAAVNRAIPLFEKTLAEYPRHTTCFSCHHQGVALFALAIARSHGYDVDQKTLDVVTQQTTADLRADLANYKSGQGQPGGVTRAGYALFAIQSVGAKPDEVTSAVSGFLLQRNKEQGFWHAASHRPPAEASDFTDTFLAIRGLKNYGSAEDKDAVRARIGRALKWLEETPPKDTEDRVFRLWGLKEAGAESALVHTAASELLAEQREDGGWAQLPGSESDAYATGSAMSVLLLTGTLPTDSAACRRGIAYLLGGQQQDGSWHVVTRSKPVQPYFESGFPYGKDQFVSVLGSGWAVIALVMASQRPHAL